MSSSTLSPPISQRGWFDVLDDWAKRDRFVFVGWSGLLLFPTAYMAIGGRALVRRLLQVGTPTDSQVVTLRVLIFSQRQVSCPADAMGHSLLLLWGPESQGDLQRWFQLGGLWNFVAAPRASRSNWVHVSSV